MKFRINLLIFILMFSTGDAQEQQKQDHFITLSLFTPVLSLAPRWNVGYIQKISNRWWAGLEAGYANEGMVIAKKAFDDDSMGDDYRIYEIHPEIYYDLRNRGKLKHTVSAALFYINHNDLFITEKYHDKSENRYYEYDKANYRRIKTGLNLNYSVLYYLTHRLVLWQKLGVGIKNRNVSYSNFENNRLSERFNDNEDHQDIFGFDNHITKEGNYVGFNFNMELKLAYSF